MTTLTFSVWPEWDFKWIGFHLEVLKHYPADYERAVQNTDCPYLKSGIENLLKALYI